MCTVGDRFAMFRTLLFCVFLDSDRDTQVCIVKAVTDQSVLYCLATSIGFCFTLRLPANWIKH